MPSFYIIINDKMVSGKYSTLHEAQNILQKSHVVTNRSGLLISTLTDNNTCLTARGKASKNIYTKRIVTSI